MYTIFLFVLNCVTLSSKKIQFELINSVYMSLLGRMNSTVSHASLKAKNLFLSLKCLSDVWFRFSSVVLRANDSEGNNICAAWNTQN